MALSKTQIDYSLGRVDKELTAARSRVTAKHTTPAKRIPDDEKAALIRAKKVTLKADITAISYYSKVEEVFDFGKFMWPDKVDDAAVQKEMAPLVEEAGRIKDRIILGDQQTALASIEEFAVTCNKKVK